MNSIETLWKPPSPQLLAPVSLDSTVFLPRAASIILVEPINISIIQCTSGHQNNYHHCNVRHCFECFMHAFLSPAPAAHIVLRLRFSQVPYWFRIKHENLHQFTGQTLQLSSQIPGKATRSLRLVNCCKRYRERASSRQSDQH